MQGSLHKRIPRGTRGQSILLKLSIAARVTGPIEVLPLQESLLNLVQPDQIMLVIRYCMVPLICVCFVIRCLPGPSVCQHILGLIQFLLCSKYIKCHRCGWGQEGVDPWACVVLQPCLISYQPRSLGEAFVETLDLCLPFREIGGAFNFSFFGAQK